MPPQPQPTSQPATQASADDYEASTPTRSADGSELYGAALDPQAPTVELSTLLASPDQFADRSVRTEGRVGRVCTNMGCWIELQDAQGAPLRTPLAGHAYFLPQSAIGKRAVVQGTVSVRPLSVEQAAHLRAEGATATAARVSLTATGVSLR